MLRHIRDSTSDHHGPSFYFIESSSGRLLYDCRMGDEHSACLKLAGGIGF